MDDYLLIAVDAQAKVSIRFGCLDQLVKNAVATHNPNDLYVKESLMQLLMASVLLGSRQDEQQTLLFKLAFEKSSVRMNCEVSSRGASRIALFPENPVLPHRHSPTHLSVSTLTRQNDIYESHIHGDSVLSSFKSYLAQSQQTECVFYLSDLTKHPFDHHYALWVERLPGCPDDLWKKVIAHLSLEVWLLVQQQTDPDQIMKSLFPEGIRILAVTKPKLTCACNREKVISSLTLLTEQDLVEIFMEGNGITTRCDYCHKTWHVSDDEIKTIIKVPPRLQ